MVPRASVVVSLGSPGSKPDAGTVGAVGRSAVPRSRTRRASGLSGAPAPGPQGGWPLGAVLRRAGGIVVAGDLPLVALVHRPTRDDWTFPKGKIEPGELPEDCARREVAEETGLRCRTLRFAGIAEHVGRRSGRPKMVAYWLMHPLGGAFQPGDEVDDLRWSGLAGALALLTYDHDRVLLARLAAETVGLGRLPSPWRATSPAGGVAG